MRAGARITRTIYEKIYREAEAYWATRKNNYHVPCSYDFAHRLLSFHPSAEPDIVLPAVLLHDVGWKMVPENKQRGAFGPEVKDREMQRFHETEGVRIAGEILHSLDYDKEKTAEILSIIDGHDTREQPLSLNDKLVKDADKLWRFTPYCVKIAYRHFGFELESYIHLLGQKIDVWFFTDEAKAMAREELNRAGKELLTPPSEREA